MCSCIRSFQKQLSYTCPIQCDGIPECDNDHRLLVRTFNRLKAYTVGRRCYVSASKVSWTQRYAINMIVRFAISKMRCFNYDEWDESAFAINICPYTYPYKRAQLHVTFRWMCISFITNSDRMIFMWFHFLSNKMINQIKRNSESVSKLYGAFFVVARN